MKRLGMDKDIVFTILVTGAKFSISSILKPYTCSQKSSENFRVGGVLLSRVGLSYTNNFFVG